MYHQFMELAEVDITKDEMEVGPTCHYVMGGIEVDPDTGAAATPGLFAAGECSGGMHGSNRLGGNSLSDLLVFGRRAGLGASDYVRALSNRPAVSEAALEEAATIALEPFNGPQGKAKPENPYTLQAELQQTMNDLVGIIRTGEEMQQALEKIEEFKVRYRNIESDGQPRLQPGLAPGDGHAQHADGQRVRGPLRAGPHREPRRAHPRRLPADGQRAGGAPWWCAAPRATIR